MDNRVPPTDMACPAHQCGNGYELVTEGDNRLLLFCAGAPQSCVAMGQCQTEQQFCSTLNGHGAVDAARSLSSVGRLHRHGTTQHRARWKSCETCNERCRQARNDNLIAECSVQIFAYCNFGQATDARFFVRMARVNHDETTVHIVAPQDGSSVRCIDFAVTWD